MKYPEYPYAYVEDGEIIFYLNHMPKPCEICNAEDCIYPDGTHPENGETIPIHTDVPKTKNVIERENLKGFG